MHNMIWRPPKLRKSLQKQAANRTAVMQSDDIHKTLLHRKTEKTMNHNDEYSNMRPRYPGNDGNTDDYALIDELIGQNGSSGHANDNTDNNTHCSLPEFSKQVPQAMVYSPHQCFDGLYDPDTALERGTLFKELDLPFGGRSLIK